MENGLIKFEKENIENVKNGFVIGIKNNKIHLKDNILYGIFDSTTKHIGGDVYIKNRKIYNFENINDEFINILFKNYKDLPEFKEYDSNGLKAILTYLYKEGNLDNSDDHPEYYDIYCNCLDEMFKTHKIVYLNIDE